MATPSPQATVVFGFDCGERRTGVAIGNTLTACARPLVILETTPTDRLFASIGELIRQWQPGLCVVGLPLTDEGEPQPMTMLSRRFARRLHGRFGLRVEFAEEAYSSVEARRGRHEEQRRRQGGQPEPSAGQRRYKTGVGPERVDDAAAAIVLEQYLRTQWRG